MSHHAQDYITSGSASGEQSPVWGGGRGRLSRLRTLPEEDAPPASPAFTLHLDSTAPQASLSPCSSQATTTSGNSKSNSQDHLERNGTCQSDVFGNFSNENCHVTQNTTYFDNKGTSIKHFTFPDASDVSTSNCNDLNSTADKFLISPNGRIDQM